MLDVERSMEIVRALVLDSGERWGDLSEQFQLEDARAILDPDQPPYHFLTRARGGSKTTDLGAVAIVVLLQLPPGARAYAIAADQAQGRLLLDAVEGFVRRTPALAEVLEVQSWRVVKRSVGATLEVLPADAPGAWGLRPWFVVADELARWAETAVPRRLWEAVSSAVAKNREARMAVLTTAGAPEHWAHGILEHARADPLWRVHEVPGPPPWIDRERLEEQRRRLPESAFRQLFLNQWTTSEDRLTTAEDLGACVTLDGPLDPVPGRSYLIGLDVGLKHDRTAAAICHAEPAGEPDRPATRVVLDRMEVWQGSRQSPVRLAEVEAWLLEASRRYGRARICLDVWQAVGLAQRLRARGVSVEEFAFSQQSVGRLASTLHLLIRNHAVALPDDEALIDELAHVRLRETAPGVLRMDHDRDKHDDRAIALALAAHRLVGEAQPTTDLGGLARGLVAVNAGFERESPWMDGDPGLALALADDPEEDGW